MMNDEEITLEALIELKEQIFSASDAELRILEIEQEIKDIKQYNIIAQQKHDEQIAKYNIYLDYDLF